MITKKNIISLIKYLGRPIKRRIEVFLGQMFPKSMANIKFKQSFGRNINWDNPTTYNEIIHREKLLSDTSLWTELADKYRVREYIKSKGFQDILVNLYGVWDNADDINFDQLPNSFVLKANNGCGTVIIVKNKQEIDIRATKKKLKSWLKTSFGYASVEPHYLGIKPLIIAEELLDATKQNGNSSKSLIDYKWFCFKGHVAFVEVVSNRTNNGFDVSIYDTEWCNHAHYVSLDRRIEKNINRPVNLNEMIHICEILSADFPQVRVDLYEIDGKIYFGELTFSAAAGTSKTKTAEFDQLLADIYYKYNS